MERDIDIMFNRKKKKASKVDALKKFYGKKEEKEFQDKKEQSVLMIQRYCKGFLSNKRLFENM